MNKPTPDFLMEAFVSKLVARLQSDDCTASDLNVIRQFLKDHDVGWETKADAEKALEKVKAALPDFDDDGNVVPMTNR